jgi:predicted TIM-barrel fold metal-dependent hydrolase
MIPKPICGIVDSHCHLASTLFIPQSFLEGSVSNVVSKLRSTGVAVDPGKILDLYLSQMQDHEGDELVAEMDAAGIDRCVLLLPDFTFALPDCQLTIAEMFSRHHEVLKKRPERFLVFAGVDPRWGGDAVQLFEKGVTEYGFAGMKLYPPCGYRASDKALYPCYEICAAYGLPVLIHTGGTSPALCFEQAQPLHADQAAHDFPGVNFILAHGTTAHVQDCAMMCSFRPNVFMDISGFQAKPLDMLREAFARGINHKIVFGTDWPVFRMQGNQRDCLHNLLDEDGPLRELRPQELEIFFRRTLERILPQESQGEARRLKSGSNFASKV